MDIHQWTSRTVKRPLTSNNQDDDECEETKLQFFQQIFVSHQLFNLCEYFFRASLSSCTIQPNLIAMTIILHKSFI